MLTKLKEKVLLIKSLLLLAVLVVYGGCSESADKQNVKIVDNDFLKIINEFTVKSKRYPPYLDSDLTIEIDEQYIYSSLDTVMTISKKKFKERKILKV